MGRVKLFQKLSCTSNAQENALFVDLLAGRNIQENGTKLFQFIFGDINVSLGELRYKKCNKKGNKKFLAQSTYRQLKEL